MKKESFDKKTGVIKHNVHVKSAYFIPLYIFFFIILSFTDFICYIPILIPLIFNIHSVNMRKKKLIFIVFNFNFHIFQK